MNGFLDSLLWEACDNEFFEFNKSFFSKFIDFELIHKLSDICSDYFTCMDMVNEYHLREKLIDNDRDSLTKMKQELVFLEVANNCLNEYKSDSGPAYSFLNKNKESIVCSSFDLNRQCYLLENEISTDCELQEDEKRKIFTILSRINLKILALSKVKINKFRNYNFFKLKFIYKNKLNLLIEDTAVVNACCDYVFSFLEMERRAYLNFLEFFNKIYKYLADSVSLDSFYTLIENTKINCYRSLFEGFWSCNINFYDLLVISKCLAVSDDNNVLLCFKPIIDDIFEMIENIENEQYLQEFSSNYEFLNNFNDEQTISQKYACCLIKNVVDSVSGAINEYIELSDERINRELTSLMQSGSFFD